MSSALSETVSEAGNDMLATIMEEGSAKNKILLDLDGNTHFSS